jgi:3-hydroxybutyryl-CoA dehydrogenase
VLATNTSSIPVTALATAAPNPANVVGMHFFNPAPVMKLLEVIAADQTGERALALARATGEAMGKAVIVAADGPGFLVNRCGRPFYTEGLRLLQEGVATHEKIDRIYRLGGGYRMGPFELMDLVGIDTGYAVAQSFTELSFGEPRWKPNPIQARMVAAGRFGRKSGRGYYDYAQEPYRPDDPEPPEAAAGPAPAPPGLVDCASSSLLSRSSTGVGFFRLPDSRLVELTRAPSTSDADAEAAERHFSSQGLYTEWVQDAPGLVLGRVVAQLVNEGCFALGEGVGSEEDIDTGLKLGLNHPVGSMEWGRRLGFDAVLATLDGIWQERREERYRPAPTLLRLARAAEA